jgi:dihydrolipoamide dehydrogenase
MQPRIARPPDLLRRAGTPKKQAQKLARFNFVAPAKGLIFAASKSHYTIKKYIMQYDVTIIGSGPGGYVAAIRCAQLGMKVAIIERYNALGGTCLNVGCIPSKALLDSSEHYHAAEKKFASHGINISNLSVDMAQMIKRKDEVVQQTNGGVKYLMDTNKIDVFTGHGKFIDRNTIAVHDKTDMSKVLHTLSTKKVIIATGSKPISPRPLQLR